MTKFSIPVFVTATLTADAPRVPRLLLPADHPDRFDSAVVLGVVAEA